MSIALHDYSSSAERMRMYPSMLICTLLIISFETAGATKPQSSKRSHEAQTLPPTVTTKKSRQQVLQATQAPLLKQIEDLKRQVEDDKKIRAQHIIEITQLKAQVTNLQTAQILKRL